MSVRRRSLAVWANIDLCADAQRICRTVDRRLLIGCHKVRQLLPKCFSAPKGHVSYLFDLSRPISCVTGAIFQAPKKTDVRSCVNSETVCSDLPPPRHFLERQRRPNDPRSGVSRVSRLPRASRMASRTRTAGNTANGRSRLHSDRRAWIVPRPTAGTEGTRGIRSGRECVRTSVPAAHSPHSRPVSVRPYTFNNTLKTLQLTEIA